MQLIPNELFSFGGRESRGQEFLLSYLFTSPRLEQKRVLTKLEEFYQCEDTTVGNERRLQTVLQIKQTEEKQI